MFVPKAHTPFQWDGQIPKDEALRRVNLVRDNTHARAVRITWHDPTTSTIEAALSRGGRDMACVIEHAWRHGARFDAWSDKFSARAWDSACKECGVDLDSLAQKTYQPGDVLPWSHISTGVSTSFLQAEYDRSRTGTTTPDCTMGPCSNCGVCPPLGTKNVLATTRVAGCNAPDTRGDVQ